MMTCARLPARVPLILMALATLLLPSLALSSPVSELIGKLTGEACLQIAASPLSQAKSILSDAATQYQNAEREFEMEKRRGERMIINAPGDTEFAGILARVEVARRKAYAFKAAFAILKVCYAMVEKESPSLSGEVGRVAKGGWTAACRNSGSSKVVANAAGTFVFNLVDNGTLYGEYHEDDGPNGAIRGRWERRSNGWAVGGSASAALGDTVGTWKGMLPFAGGGAGDVEVSKRSMDLNCAGRWTAQ